MANLLYLVHRMPYPPDKGDKVRSYHLLKQLLLRHRVFLGTFVDDAQDLQHIDTLRALCGGLHVVQLQPRMARLRSLAALLGGDALTLRYYADAGLAEWVARTVREQGIDTAVVFSSSMAQYAERIPGLRMLVDFVDVDSAKWSQYAAARTWPMSWLYRREAECLLAYEREMAMRAKRSFVVTESETALFRGLAPECAGAIEPMGNGVDADYFAPAAARPSPFAADELPVVFTGAMDYWPNVDAVCWFAGEVLPELRRARPALRFYIVGRSPSAKVQALAGPAVSVTGTVPDVRPYLQHAALVVAPLRLARGIQNKVLEAMAMGRPVLASATCAQSIDARLGIDLLAAIEPEDYVREIEAVLSDAVLAQALGRAGRQCVLERYSWATHMGRIEPHLVPEAVA